MSGADNPDEARVPTLPEVMMGKILKRLVSENAVNIIIVGLTGTGKSALVNAFLGYEHNEVDAAEEGAGINKGCTLAVKGKPSVRPEQKGLCVWDTPGLKDGACSKDKKRYLEEIGCIWKRCKSHDLVIFCIKADTRFVEGKDNNNIKIMIKLHKKFGKKFWENALIVLTFANTIEALNPEWKDMTKEEKKEEFEKKFKEYENQIKKTMRECVKIDPKVIEKMKIVPAGHYTNPILPDREHWYTALWLKCIETLPNPDSQILFAFHNQDIIETRPGERDSSNRIFLTPEFIPKDFLEIKKKHEMLGGLLGLLGLMGGPLALVTVPVGMRVGSKMAETKYGQVIRQQIVPNVDCSESAL